MAERPGKDLPGNKIREMTLLVDTRQQKGKHRNVEAYCRRIGMMMKSECLNVGDYMFPGGRISVDTKMDVLELAKDVMSSDHRRFRAECIRAQEAGIQLVILVEEELPFGRLDLWEVPKWTASNKWHRYGDPMTLVKPEALRKACITMQEKYGVKFRFCKRSQSPKRIIQYLRGELQ